jgi:hypothetical protein
VQLRAHRHRLHRRAQCPQRLGPEARPSLRAEAQISARAARRAQQRAEDLQRRLAEWRQGRVHAARVVVQFAPALLELAVEGVRALRRRTGADEFQRQLQARHDLLARHRRAVQVEHEVA